MVAAALHGHGQLVGPAERRDEERNEDGHQGLDALGEVTGIQHGAAGLLGVHDLFRFLDEGGDEPQRDGHHHSQLMHREVHLGQRAQQVLDGVG